MNYPIVKIKDVSSIERGKRVVREQLLNSGKYAVYQNALSPLGFFDEFNRNANKVFVISAGAAGQIGFSKENFWAADDCLTFNCNERLDERFLFHVLKNKQNIIDSFVRKASVPRISKENIGDISFGLPTLDIQKKIANVLDHFDSICSNLNIGLPAEIDARQKQYEYYRDLLLTFAETGKIIAQTDRQTD